MCFVIPLIDVHHLFFILDEVENGKIEVKYNYDLQVHGQVQQCIGIDELNIQKFIKRIIFK